MKNSKTKVLFTFGGLPHYYNKVLNRLQKDGEREVVVVTPQQRSTTIGAGVKQSDKGIEFRNIKLPERKQWYGKVFLEGLNETIATEKPDIVITVWPYVLGFLFSRKLQKTIRKHNIKLVFKDIPFLLPKYEDALEYYSGEYFRSVNESLEAIPNTITFRIKMRFLNWCRKQYYSKLIDAHVSYVEKAHEILPTYGVLPESIFVTYNSPDTNQLFQTKAKVEQQETILVHSKQRVLHVGRLVKWKRVDLLLEAFAKISIKLPSAELVVVGTGPELENLKQQAKDLQLTQQVVFVGGVYQQEELAHYFIESTVYVLAGMGGLSINEAMAYGKPVVCSVCDGTEQHLVKNGKNGYFFQENNANDLSEKILHILENDALCCAMGNESERIVREEINIDTVIAGYERAFSYLQQQG